jgi:hypothetical protein
MIGLAMLCGCSDVITCDGSLVPAIELSVIDAGSKAFIASQAIVIVSRSGAPTDTIANPAGADSDPILIGTSAGTYGLLVRKSGYADWIDTGIVVNADASTACHPKTLTLQASLAKVP